MNVKHWSDNLYAEFLFQEDLQEIWNKIFNSLPPSSPMRITYILQLKYPE